MSILWWDLPELHPVLKDVTLVRDHLSFLYPRKEILTWKTSLPECSSLQLHSRTQLLFFFLLWAPLLVSAWYSRFDGAVGKCPLKYFLGQRVIGPSSRAFHSTFFMFFCGLRWEL